ncbi:hypothetical protein NUW54_g2667 [Trametes sanguinea]|uniref:Uncharacterized protein n=1 Tax=Trametes sanguinea TaxID=158606 RepID=A0ACC1Q6N7_9APHY|nr:hypothetical protein NUW54_g2667 [Trametes sanguinea]
MGGSAPASRAAGPGLHVLQFARNRCQGAGKAGRGLQEAGLPLVNGRPRLKNEWASQVVEEASQTVDSDVHRSVIADIILQYPHGSIRDTTCTHTRSSPCPQQQHGGHGLWLFASSISRALREPAGLTEYRGIGHCGLSFQGQEAHAADCVLGSTIARDIDVYAKEYLKFSHVLSAPHTRASAPRQAGYLSGSGVVEVSASRDFGASWAGVLERPRQP